jgi:adenylylsulfate kinase
MWLTGPSGSGKTTISKAIADHPLLSSISKIVLDGDEIRATISKDLKPGPSDRKENLKRVLSLIQTSLKTHNLAIVALVSPDSSLRQFAKDTLEASGHRFIEIYVCTPIDMCAGRDVKGLYLKSQTDPSILLPGYNDRYDIPSKPDITCFTDKERLETCASKVASFFLAPIQTDPQSQDLL